jgi:hypothetical protein
LVLVTVDGVQIFHLIWENTSNHTPSLAAKINSEGRNTKISFAYITDLMPPEIDKKIRIKEKLQAVSDEHFKWQKGLYVETKYGLIATWKSRTVNFNYLEGESN